MLTQCSISLKNKIHWSAYVPLALKIIVFRCTFLLNRSDSPTDANYLSDKSILINKLTSLVCVMSFVHWNNFMQVRIIRLTYLLELSFFFLWLSKYLWPGGKCTGQRLNDLYPLIQTNTSYIFTLYNWGGN